jgi:hypothetical protein
MVVGACVTVRSDKCRASGGSLACSSNKRLGWAATHTGKGTRATRGGIASERARKGAAARGYRDGLRAIIVNAGLLMDTLDLGGEMHSDHETRLHMEIWSRFRLFLAGTEINKPRSRALDLGSSTCPRYRGRPSAAHIEHVLTHTQGKSNM